MFRFIKKVFFIGLKVIKFRKRKFIKLYFNQACKARPEIINVNGNNPVFYLLLLKQVNVGVIVIILMIKSKSMFSRCCKGFKR